MRTWNAIPDRRKNWWLPDFPWWNPTKVWWSDGPSETASFAVRLAYWYTMQKEARMARLRFRLQRLRECFGQTFDDAATADFSAHMRSQWATALAVARAEVMAKESAKAATVRSLGDIPLTLDDYVRDGQRVQ